MWCMSAGISTGMSARHAWFDEAAHGGPIAGPRPPSPTTETAVPVAAVPNSAPATTAVAMVRFDMTMLRLVRPLVRRHAARLPSTLRGARAVRPSGAPARPHAAAVPRVGQHRVSHRIGHLVERAPIEVRKVVARLVVAGVGRLAGRAAVHARLCGRLDILGPGEQAPGGDPGRDERTVVAAPVERRRLGPQALRREVAREHLLDRAGPRGCGRGPLGPAERRVVTVVDESDEVRG